MKGRKVCIKTRSPPASLSLKGKVTKHTTVKWTIKGLMALWPYVKKNVDIFHFIKFALEPRKHFLASL